MTDFGYATDLQGPKDGPDFQRSRVCDFLKHSLSAGEWGKGNMRTRETQQRMRARLRGHENKRMISVVNLSRLVLGLVINFHDTLEDFDKDLETLDYLKFHAILGPQGPALIVGPNVYRSGKLMCNLSIFEERPLKMTKEEKKGLLACVTRYMASIRQQRSEEEFEVFLNA